MASVTSLDKDLRNLRLSRYTPQAAAEVRDWIEEVLHESLPAGDLLEALKDGVALCRLVNLAVSPGVKFKQSSMPFVQMENISHFLRACQIQPLSLAPHDVFLTVDLYEGKDPAQVLQCLMAFSRRANAIQPSKFPRTIGPQNKGGTLSPNMTGSSQGAYTPTKSRFYNGVSDTASNISAQSSPSAKSPAVSSWSKKTDEHSTAPAWNIHQYGYMGGASQANQGVAFGARRQITTAAPHVPSLAEKEKRRREEEDRLRAEQEHAERMRQLQREEREAEEERARAEEARRWEEETAQLREKERLEVEQQRRQWDEEQHKWEEEERQRQREERETEDRIDKERQRRREVNDTRLNGQFLSQYQASQPVSGRAAATEPSENQRIRQLELELESAKEREAQYERERRALREKATPSSNSNTPPARSPRPVPVPPKPSYDLSSLEQERRLLRTEWQDHQREEPIAESSPPPMPPRRPLPDPTSTASSGGPPPKPPRPLPDPVNQMQESRVDRFLSFNRPPVAAKPAAHRPQDYSTTSEVDAENSRREAAQQKTKAGGWASKSLLEREMERERERQREWEDNQKQTEAVAAQGLGDSSIGTGPGQGAWNVHQYGFLGGDSQNRGGPGLGVGGARRQIIGPRPPP
ncbi:calponin [Aspergillus melleus]|uniref:Calponin n=1 Tax=Aspergillus melleus TaxID=138277 RepID=A0ACC3AXY5_9EURO|nr:calponin [Aspergillus melleus]